MSKRARQQAHIRALQAARQARIDSLIRWHDDVIEHVTALAAEMQAKKEAENVE